MIGGVLRAAGTMAAYALGSSATKKAATWALEKVRHNAGVMVSRAIARAPKNSLRADSAVQRAKSFQRAVGTGSGSISSLISKRESSFVKSLSSKQANRYRNLRNVVTEEASQLPVNYAMYRIERSRATNPEDKQRTNSFVNWYVKDQMAFSIGAGLALTSGASKMKKIPGIVGRHISKEAVVKGTEMALHSAERVSNLAGRIKSTKRIFTNSMAGLGPSKLFNPSVRKKFVNDIKYNARKEAFSSTLNRQYSLDNMTVTKNHFSSKVISKVSDYRRDKSMELHRYRQMAKEGKDDFLKNESFADFENNFNASTDHVSRSLLRGYQNEARQTSGFMKVLNSINQVKSGLKIEKQTVDFNAGKYFGKSKTNIFRKEDIDNGYNNFVADPNIVTYNNKSYDLRNFNSGTLKSVVVDGMQRGVMGSVTKLFGLKDVLNSMLPDQKVPATNTFRKAGSLILPVSIKETNENLVSVIDNITVKPLDYSSSPEDAREEAKAFLKSRADILKSHPDIQRANLKASGKYGDNAFLNSEFGIGHVNSFMEHGSIPVGNGDVLIHTADGKVLLQSNITVRDQRKNVLLNLTGLMPAGTKVLKYTSQESANTKSMRYALGSRQAPLVEDGVTYGYLNIGPRMTGKVMDSLDDSFIGRMKRKLDIGKSEETGILSSIRRIFTRHTDPNAASTLFSKDYLLSEPGLDKLFSNENPEVSMNSLQNVYNQVNKHSKQLWDNLYVTKMRSNSTKDVKQFIQDIGLDPKEVEPNLLLPSDSADMAKRKIQKHIERLKAGYDSDQNAVTNPFVDDLQELYRLNEFVSSDPNITGYDLLGGKSTTRRVRRGMNLSVPITNIDAFNSMVLRNTTKGQTPKNLHGKDYMMFKAADHMTRFRNELGKEYTKMGVHMSEDELNGSFGEVKNIVRNFTGENSADYNSAFKEVLKSNHEWTFSTHGRDNRLRVEREADWNETYIIAQGKSYSPITKSNLGYGNTSINGMLGVGNLAVMNTLHSINRVASMVHLGFSEADASTPGAYVKKILTQRMLPAAAIYGGYQVLDRTADMTLDGTPLGEGITMFGMNMYANARIGTAGIMDAMGVTKAAKWAEDLMPGLVDSPLAGIARGFGSPLAGISLGYKAGGPGGAIMGGMIGSAVSLLTAGGPLAMFGNWSLDKSREEVIQELSGEKEIAVKASRWWELSSSPFEGTNTKYFRPHMYAMMRSKYQQTPGLKDSILSDIVGGIAPDFMGIKNYYSRPFPITAGFGSGIPVLSNILSLVPGFPPGSGVPMHEDFMNRKDKFSSMSSGEGFGGNILNNYSELDVTSNLYTDRESVTGPYGERVIDPASGEYAAGAIMDEMKSIIGLRGFMMGTTFEKITGQNSAFNTSSVMATPADITSISKDFWDKNLGGMLGANEIIRRFLPDKRKDIDIYNPIVNDAPSWLPGAEYFHDFQHGDKFAEIELGEARLPGAGYRTLHNVNFDTPIDAESMGETKESQINYYLTLPEYMQPRNQEKELAKDVAQKYIEQLKQSGQVSRQNATVYNADLNMSATVDLVLQTQSGSVPIKIAPKGFGAEAALNAFMLLSDSKVGTLIEVDTETGGMTERQLRQDRRRFEKDLAVAKEATNAARAMIPKLDKKYKNASFANSYSWMDRFNILSDVAPYSDEYKTARNIVEMQIDNGKLSHSDVLRYDAKLDQVNQVSKQYDFKEYRFLTLGKSLTEQGKREEQSIYQNYSAPEIVLGSAWERLSHLKNPISNKFMWNMSSTEAYETLSVYGKRMKRWDDPWEDYGKSAIYEAMSNDDIAQGAIQMGSIGAIAGAMMGGLPMQIAAGGAMLGGGLSAFNKVSGVNFVPERTKERREIESQIDAIEYAKNMKLYQETGNSIFLKNAKKSMTYNIQNNKIPTAEELKYFTGYADRPFLSEVIKHANTDNINRLEAILPKEILPTLYSETGNMEQANSSQSEVYDIYKDKQLPGLNSSLYNPAINPEIVSIEEYDNRGLSSHDSGLGFYNHMKQLHQMKSSDDYNPNDKIFPITGGTRISEFNSGLSTTNNLRSALSQFSSRINIVEDGSDSIELVVVVSS